MIIIIMVFALLYLYTGKWQTVGKEIDFFARFIY